MTSIQQQLSTLGEPKYAAFQAKLIPNISQENILGVRVPVLRHFARDFAKNNPQETEKFLDTLPHKYLEENFLHGFLITQIKDYDQCIERTEAFLPYVNNWAVCDTMSPKVFKKHRPQLLQKIRQWAASDNSYTIRFGIEMLMAHFLNEDFTPDLLEIPAAVHSEEYYVKMMVAWYYATALAKQYEAAIPVIEKKLLEKWTHNKTIQKAIESFRVTDDHKEYLRTLKV